MVVGSVETAATGAVTRQGDATGQGGRDREPAYSILSARRISIYILKRRRGLSLYSTVDAAVCRAVGGELVAAIPQRAPGAPELGGVMRHHSITTQQNECRYSVATRCPQPYPSLRLIYDSARASPTGAESCHRLSEPYR